jgi:hypothetical protein
MSLSTNFPTVNPTLNLNFLNAGVLDSRITFSRGSTATYFDQLGVLQTAQNNIPRFDYNPATLAAQGLLIEEQRTNSCLQSEDFATTWTVTGATVSTNAATAPNGTATADKLAEDSSTGSHLVSQNITYGVGAYTASLFAKKAERDWVRVLFFDGTTTFSAFFNLNTGVVGTVTGTGASAAIQSVGNGWYRCLVTATTAAGAGSFAPRVALADNNSSYTGSTGSGIFIWGAQLEAGAFATSYIPTTTTALTRNADVASMTGTNFSSWFNEKEGTLFVEAATAAAADVFVFADINSGATNNFIRQSTSSAGTTVQLVVQVLGSTTASPGVAVTLGSVRKAAGAYKVDSVQQAVNGTLGTEDTTATIPTGMSQMNLGSRAGSLNDSQVWIARITYYPTRLTNAQLQALTL